MLAEKRPEDKENRSEAPNTADGDNETQVEVKDKVKPKKERNDRESIDLMRKLLNDAYKGKVLSTQTQDHLRLEFSHVVNSSYLGHQLMAKEIILNPNL